MRHRRLRRGNDRDGAAAETNARELFRGDTVVLRFGLFIGPDSGLTQADIERARNTGASPSVGRRDAHGRRCGSMTPRPRWPLR